MRIADFELTERLYEGRSTIVYAGVRTTDRLAVVAKLVADNVRDLRREHGLMQRAAGDGVVETLGIFDSSEGPVLVQHRFGNGTVVSLCERGAAPLTAALQVGVQLTHVLQRSQAEIVHYRELSDPIAAAAIGILSSVMAPTSLTGRTLLWVLQAEVAMRLILDHGRERYTASFLVAHAMVLQAVLKNFTAARRCYDVCLAREAASPAHEIGGRTYLVMGPLSLGRACAATTAAKCIQGSSAESRKRAGNVMVSPIAGGFHGTGL